MDRDLVEAAQRGDQAAFVDLVRFARRTGSSRSRYRILRDVDRAEDALQDALVIAWRDLRGLRDPDRFDAWLHRLLVNVCIDQATRERRRAANLRVLPVDGPAAPDDLLTIADRDQLERGFRRLSPDQRAILVLHHYVGYAPSEIAETARHPAGDGPLPTPSRPSRHARRARRGRPGRPSSEVVRHDPAIATSNDSSTLAERRPDAGRPIASSTSSPTGSAASPSGPRGASTRRHIHMNASQAARWRSRPSSSSPSLGYALLPGERARPSAGRRRASPTVVPPARHPRRHRRRRRSRRGSRRRRRLAPGPDRWQPYDQVLRCPPSRSTSRRVGSTAATQDGFYGLFPDTPANGPSTLPPEGLAQRSHGAAEQPGVRLRRVGGHSGRDRGRDGRRHRGQRRPCDVRAGRRRRSAA